MKLLYDAGIRLYGAAISAASLKSDKAKRLRDGRRTVFDELEQLTTDRAPNGYDYWLRRIVRRV